MSLWTIGAGPITDYISKIKGDVSMSRLTTGVRHSLYLKNQRSRVYESVDDGGLL